MTNEQLMEVNKGIKEWGLKNIENIILIKSGATNGDVIMAIFPNVDKYHNMLLENHSKNILFNDDWWNAPYQKGIKV